eukprot:5358743-Prymnesium_polylepis.1
MKDSHRLTPSRPYEWLTPARSPTQVFNTSLRRPNSSLSCAAAGGTLKPNHAGIEGRSRCCRSA